MRPIAWIVLVLSLSYVAARTAQQPAAPWQLTEISRHLPDLSFALIDDSGKGVTAQSYHGKVVLLYFGFAGCSAQCPLTLARLSAMLNALGEQAGYAQILFASIDPAHDTPGTLRQYLAPFNTAHMTGLTGTPAQIEALAKRYRTVYRSDFAGADKPHSDTIYLFDPASHARLLASAGDTPEMLAHDVALLLKEN